MAHSKPKLREVLEFIGCIRRSASQSKEDEAEVVVDLLVSAIYDIDERLRQKILDRWGEDYSLEAPRVYDPPELPF